MTRRGVEPCWNSRSHVLSMTDGCTGPIYYQGDASAGKGSVIIRSTWAELIKKLTRRGTLLSCSLVSYGGESNPAWPESCFKHDRRMYLSDILPGSCQSWKKKCDNSMQNYLSLSKKFLRRRTLLSLSNVSSMTMLGSRTPLSRRHVSSVTGGWTCPIYQGSFWGGERRSPVAMFQAWLGRGVEPCSPAAVFQAWQARVLIRYTIRGLAVLKKEVW